MKIRLVLASILLLLCVQVDVMGQEPISDENTRAFWQSLYGMYDQWDRPEPERLQTAYSKLLVVMQPGILRALSFCSFFDRPDCRCDLAFDLAECSPPVKIFDRGYPAKHVDDNLFLYSTNFRIRGTAIQNCTCSNSMLDFCINSRLRYSPVWWVESVSTLGRTSCGCPPM